MIEDSDQRESPQTTNLENFPFFFSVYCILFFSHLFIVLCEYWGSHYIMLPLQQASLLKFFMFRNFTVLFLRRIHGLSF